MWIKSKTAFKRLGYIVVVSFPGGQSAGGGGHSTEGAPSSAAQAE